MNNILIIGMRLIGIAGHIGMLIYQDNVISASCLVTRYLGTE